MKKEHILFGLLLVFLAGLAVAFFQKPDPIIKEPDLQDMLSVPKTAVQMQLYSANRDPVTGKSASGKSLGFEYFKEDGRVKYYARTVFESGASQEIYWRQDGSRERAISYFPLKSGEERPLVHSRASFEKDGSTFLSHDVFNDAGRKVRSGRLLEDGFYEQSYFCGDGKAKERVRRFDAKKEFKSEQVFDCASGRVYAEILPGNYNGQLKIIVLREDGSREAELLKDYSGIGGSVFARDGKTLLAKYRSDYGSKSVKYFADGDEEKLRLEISTTWGRTKVTSYDLATGKKLRVQEWRELPTDNPDKKVEVLVRVTDYALDKENSKTREVEMSADGKQAEKVAFPLAPDLDLKTLVLPENPSGLSGLENLRSQMNLVHTLDGSGKVVKTELTIEYQSWNNKVQPAPANPLRFNFAPDLFKMPAHDEPPVFNREGPGRVYDYEGENPSMTYSNPYSGYEWGPH